MAKHSFHCVKQLRHSCLRIWLFHNFLLYVTSKSVAVVWGYTELPVSSSELLAERNDSYLVSIEPV